MEPKPNPFVFVSLLQGVGEQTQVSFTLATTMVFALLIFVAAFLLGLWCGWVIWRRQHRRLQASVELKRRARA